MRVSTSHPCPSTGIRRAIRGLVGSVLSTGLLALTLASVPDPAIAGSVDETIAVVDASELRFLDLAGLPLGGPFAVTVDPEITFTPDGSVTVLIEESQVRFFDKLGLQIGLTEATSGRATVLTGPQRVVVVDNGRVRIFDANGNQQGPTITTMPPDAQAEVTLEGDRVVVIDESAAERSVPLRGGPWADSFDAYAPGSGLHGQGGWHGWDGSPAADAYVSNAESFSPPHSANIIETSDIVQEFAGLTGGYWVFRCMQYIPIGSTGLQYLNLLNTYNDFGPYNWSTEIRFNSNTGMVRNDGPSGGTTPIIFGQWVEVRVEIDLDADAQSMYYNGTLLAQETWTGGVTGGGVLNIAALDLYSNGASPIYYDDVSLDIGVPPQAHTVRIFDTQGNQQGPSIAANVRPSVVTDGAGMCFVVVDNGRVRIYDASGSQQGLSISTSPSDAKAEVKLEGDRIVVIDDDSVRIFDKNGNQQGLSISTNTHATVVTDGAGMCFVVIDNGRVRIYDASGNQQGLSISTSPSDAKAEVKLDGDRIIVIDDDSVRIFDKNGNQQGLSISTNGHASVSISPDGERIVVTDNDSVRIFDRNGSQQGLTINTVGEADVEFATGRVLVTDFVAFRLVDHGGAVLVQLTTDGPGTTVVIPGSAPLGVPGVGGYVLMAYQNQPNPFNPRTTIRFVTPSRGDVSVRIYDVSGQLVRTLLDERLEGGAHAVMWDGTNTDDRPVASGIYFYRIDGFGGSQVRKMTLVR